MRNTISFRLYKNGGNCRVNGKLEKFLCETLCPLCLCVQGALLSLKASRFVLHIGHSRAPRRITFYIYILSDALSGVCEILRLFSHSLLSFNLLISLSKSETIFCVLLNSSYSSIAFCSAFSFDILPLSAKILNFLKFRNSFTL